jgi:hypothetical protein
MYHYTKKMNGKKYTLALWPGDSQTCTRIAECVFSHHGLEGGDTEWEHVTKQKMYAGNHVSCKFFDDTPRQATEYFHNELITDYANMKGASAARTYLLEMWQDNPEAIEDVVKFFKDS